MHVRSLGFQTDLALLELGGSTVEHFDDHLVIRSPMNPTHWWGNFLLVGSPPPAGDADVWIDQFHDAFPDARHVALGFDGIDGVVSDLASFTALGYRVEAQTVMTARAVHAPAHVDPRAELRALRTDEDWAQSVELHFRCRAEDLNPDGYLEYATARVRTHRATVEAGVAGWFGAFVDGRLASQMGLVRAGPTLARFQSVETDPDFRRRGLAGSLVHVTSRHGFEVFGAETLVMVADPDYFAIDLYRAVGFAPTESQLQVERPPS